MKHLKMLAIGAAAAMALITFGAATASATTLTSPDGTIYTGEVIASVDGTVKWIEPELGTLTCTEGVIKGTPNAQSDTTTVTIPVSTLTLGSPRGTNEEESSCANGALMI